MDCQNLLETESVRAEFLNVVDRKETSARLSLGERRRDLSRWDKFGEQIVEYSTMHRALMKWGTLS